MNKITINALESMLCAYRDQSEASVLSAEEFVPKMFNVVTTSNYIETLVRKELGHFSDILSVTSVEVTDRYCGFDIINLHM